MHISPTILIAIVVAMGAGWLAFFWLRDRPRGGPRDLIAPPSAPAAHPPAARTLPPEIEAKARALLAQGQKLEAIKEVRAATSMSLTEAKELIESL